MRLGKLRRTLLLATVAAIASVGFATGGARAGTTAAGGPASGGWDYNGWTINWTATGSVDGAAVTGAITCTGSLDDVYLYYRLSCAGSGISFPVTDLAIAQTVVADPESEYNDTYTTWLITGTSPGADFRCAGHGYESGWQYYGDFSGACSLTSTTASQHVDLPKPANATVDVGSNGVSACRTSGPGATGCAAVSGASPSAQVQGPAGTSAQVGPHEASACRSGEGISGCPTAGWLNGPGVHWHNYTGLLICTPGGRACAGDYYVFPFPTKTVSRAGLTIVTGPDGAEICAVAAGASGCTGNQGTSYHVDTPPTNAGTSLAGKAEGFDRYNPFGEHHLSIGIELDGTYAGQPVASTYDCEWDDPEGAMAGGTMPCSLTGSPAGAPPSSFTVTNVSENLFAQPVLTGDVFTNQHLACDLAWTFHDPANSIDNLLNDDLDLWGVCTIS